jgi:hypothetical protein
MSYQVVYTEQFHAALDAQLIYFAEQGAPDSRIVNWLSELLVLVDSLNESPHRFAVAEPESAARGVERGSSGGFCAGAVSAASVQSAKMPRSIAYPKARAEAGRLPSMPKRTRAEMSWSGV